MALPDEHRPALPDVVFFTRRPQGVYSIERVFEDVRAALASSARFTTRLAISRYPSRGVWRRLFNIVEAWTRQGDINHVTGDVHFLAYLLARRKTLVTMHDCVSLDRATGLRKHALWVLWYWLPARRAAIITTVSQASRSRLRHYLGSTRDIRVIHCPVSPAFQYRPRDLLQPPTILQVGTAANKNLQRLAEALVGLDVRLRVIGRLDAGQRTALGRHGIDYSQVEDVSSEQLVHEYAECDVVAFVSTYEGFGLPIVEAQATGRPVVTSNIMSMPEVAGDGACLVDPFDVASIRAGVERVLGDDSYRRQLVEAGIRNVERFRVDKVASQYEALYRELLRRR